MGNLARSAFKPPLKKAGLPMDLRHTYTTHLLSMNVNPKTVSEILGHSSIAIILDTYLHVLPNVQQSAGRARRDS